MRVGFAVAAALILLSGCAADAPRGDTPAPVVDPCPVPDRMGKAFECDNSAALTAGITATRPTLMDGWRCVTNYSSGDLGTLSSYANRDGRVGVYWDVKPIREGRPNFIEAQIFHARGDAIALIVPYVQRGFASFPEKPREDPVEMHLTMKAFGIEVRERGGDWQTMDNFSVLVNRVEGEAWYVTEYNTSTGTHFLDMIEKRPAPDTKRKYQATEKFHEGPDHDAYGDVGGGGAKYPSISFTVPSTGMYACPAPVG